LQIAQVISERFAVPIARATINWLRHLVHFKFLPAKRCQKLTEIQSETRGILANCHPQDLRSHVIVLRLAHKSGAVFRRLFLTPWKNGFNKLWVIRYSRRFAFKSTQKRTWFMRTSLCSCSIWYSLQRPFRF
jgi:hypothetical protein